VGGDTTYVEGGVASSSLHHSREAELPFGTWDFVEVADPFLVNVEIEPVSDHCGE
jgi:hypothetical protein